ncbi:MAG: helix-turn-helix domain-containing protein [Corallococcus sp.]|nr:helix-turn-helix domain-containing protein [Corallococcus sp.]
MLTSLELYEKVDKLRIRNGMTVAELNRRAGISHATLSSWKQRKTMPTIELLEALGYALNVSVAALLFDVDADSLSGDETELLYLWRKLNGNQRQALLAVIKSFKE